MSDFIPFEMQMEIINRLPVKYVLRCRKVSKSWKGFIDSPTFFAKYGVRKSTKDVYCLKYNQGTFGYLLYVDANLIHTGVIQNLSVTNLKPIGSSMGLLCFSFNYNMMVVIANPSIRKKFGVFAPNSERKDEKVLFGFGVRLDNLDPIVVKISLPCNVDGNWLVHVFSLISQRWNLLDTNLLPRQSIRLKRSTQAVVGQFIYWVGYERQIYGCGHTHKHYLLVSFDTITRCFREIVIPDMLLRNHFPPFYVANLQNSLVLSENLISEEYNVFVCYRLSINEGIITSFPEIMALQTLHSLKLLGFNNQGMPLVEKFAGDVNGNRFLVYMENSQSFQSLPEVLGNAGSFFVANVKESLIMASYEDRTRLCAGHYIYDN